MNLRCRVVKTAAAPLIALVWGSTGLPVLAADGLDATIEEIVVTARKRSENLQEIPDSITVFDTQIIERSGIANITDFAAMTPNLSAYGNFRPNLTNISIRGLTSTQLGEPPIAFVVDGITVPNIEFMNQGLVDIEQIEVIRGPQGALYGKNAIGGVVNITTKAPGETTQGSIRASYGEGNDLGLNATVSGRLSDRVVYRLAGFFRDFDGLIDDTFTGQESDFVEEFGFQGLLGFQLSDQTYVDVRARYSDGDYGVGYYSNADIDTLSSESVRIAHNVLPLDENKLFNIAAKLEHETAQGDFTLVAGYNTSDDENFLDSDFSTLPPDFDNFFFTGGQASRIEDKAFTLETRFISPTERRLRWLVGAYYQDRERDNDFDIFDDPDGTILQTRASLANEFLLEIVRDRQDSKAYALFGQINYDLTEQLELTVGLRYDEEKRDGVDPRDPTSAASRTFDEVQPKFSLAWQVNDALLAYITGARGFRSGGFNEVAGGVTRSFEAETSDTLEIGFKSTLIDGVLSLNGALFSTEQDNGQFTRFNPFTFSLEQLSIEKVDIRGAEIEASWAPVDSLDIRLGVGILDSEIKDFDPAAFDAPPVGIIGNAMPRVADWNANLSATHSYDLGADRSLVSQLSANWLGERNFDLENTLTDKKAVYINASVGVETTAWTLQLRATNLFDEFEPEDAFPGIASPVAVYRNQPRQILGEFMYRF